MKKLQDNEKLQKEIDKIRKEDQELTNVIFKELYDALHVQRDSLVNLKQKRKVPYSKQA